MTSCSSCWAPDWQASTETVRLLAPTIAVMAVISPMGWLISSLGLCGGGALILRWSSHRSWCWAARWGCRYGAAGVALAYSAVMVLWMVPHVAWCVHGTAITLRDVLATVIRPLASGLAAGAVGYAMRLMSGEFLSPVLRLVLESGVLAVTFFVVLILMAGQRKLYVDLLRGLSRGRRDQDYANTTGGKLA